MDSLPNEILFGIVDNLISCESENLLDTFHLSLTNKRLHEVADCALSKRILSILKDVPAPPWQTPLRPTLVPESCNVSKSKLQVFYDYYIAIIALDKEIQPIAVQLTAPKSPMVVTHEIDSEDVEEVRKVVDLVHEASVLWRDLEYADPTHQFLGFVRDMDAGYLSWDDWFHWRWRPELGMGMDLAAMWSDFRMRYVRKTRNLIMERTKRDKNPVN
ncbi:uncharacterized protein KY384_003481 [Bacidia gigantensis]|uniref:uncharacterized protein n=1 Tax=Bacidia gigantensis TaxID=2732470 RepID=UPI001D05BDE6|nr:uncharacterized protein KY384_003481 [Bacidia gigantensis]KAG8531845.1 hypothetical protein KY384_003481 [Bacidia gigantensis]